MSMTNSEKNSCCICGGSLKDKKLGHLFACSHPLCADCLEGFGNHPLRSVCFTCATPEREFPNGPIWPNEETQNVSNQLKTGKNPNIITMETQKSWKDSKNPEIIGHVFRTQDDLEKPSVKNSDDVIVTWQLRHGPTSSENRRLKGFPVLERFLRSMDEKRTEAEELEAAFERRIEEARKAITAHAQKCRSLIDRDERCLLQQLEEMRMSTVRESSMMRSNIEGVIERTKEMVKGGKHDGTEVEQLLSARVNSVQFQSIDLDLYSIMPRDEKNVVGELSFQTIPDNSSILSTPVFIGSIPGNSKPITGICVLDRRIFVVNDIDPEIFVYQLGTLARLPSISLLHLLEPIQVPSALDLVACLSNRCLYVLDSTNSLVWRLRPEDGRLIKWWSVKNPHNLSVTVTGTVLVTSEKKIFEYDPSGTLMRTISPPLLAPIRPQGDRRPMIRYPRHAVEADGGRLIVSDFQDERTAHVVYVTDRKGALSRWHGNAPASGADGFNEPRHLAIAVSGHVMVADRRNDRVILMNERLEFVKDLVTSATTLVEVESPLRLCLDLARGHLYVGQSNGLTMIFRVLL